MNIERWWRSSSSSRLWAVVLMALSALAFGHAAAGSLSREALQAELSQPGSPLDGLVVGPKVPGLPVWTAERRNGPFVDLRVWAFETVDVEPVAGYGGKPANSLVVMDRAGRLLAVRLLSHAEPIFRSPEGTAKLAKFAAQYEGLTAQTSVQVMSPKAERTVGEGWAQVHGVTAGTVSALAIDKGIMEAAAQVHAQLQVLEGGGVTGATGVSGAVPKPAPRGPDDRYERTGWNALLKSGLLQPFAVTHRALQQALAGTPAALRDAEAQIRPTAAGLEVWVALVGLPQAGRNLLDVDGWRAVRALREEGVQTLLVVDNSRYPLQAAGPNRSGANPAQRASRLEVRQGGRLIPMQALDAPFRLRLTGQHSGVGANAVPRLLRTAPGATLDPEQPLEVSWVLQRRHGDEPDAISEAPFIQRFEIPNASQWRPQREVPAWFRIWQERWVDLAVLAAGLAVLSAALVAQRRLTASTRRLAAFRTAYLLFTVGFIGYWAQGQLTIVNLTAAAGALLEGQGLEFLLSDPMAVLLWAYVGVTLVVWGRGTFCGWLCPFGALQELINRAVAPLRASLARHGHRYLGLPRRLRLALDHRLKRVKYGVLAVVAATVPLSTVTANPVWTDWAVEVEPFKTAISLHFDRAWPYGLWAALCLGVTLAVYRGYCRYLCPLGAALALLSALRERVPGLGRFGWIARRTDCGSPCQTCRHTCEYQAIEPSGAVDYRECFQCQDCVAVHDDEHRCMPLIVQRKHAARIIPIRAEGAA